MARGVDDPRHHGAEGHRVPGSERAQRVLERLEVLGEVDLGALHVDGEIAPPEQLAHAVGVVLVRVGEQDPREALAVDGAGLLDGVHVPGRIHDDHVALSLGPHEVDEVLHRTERELVQEELCGHGCPGGRFSPAVILPPSVGPRFLGYR
jgi:hypothetical protein